MTPFWPKVLNRKKSTRFYRTNNGRRTGECVSKQTRIVYNSGKRCSATKPNFVIDNFLHVGPLVLTHIFVSVRGFHGVKQYRKVLAVRYGYIDMVVSAVRQTRYKREIARPRNRCKRKGRRIQELLILLAFVFVGHCGNERDDRLLGPKSHRLTKCQRPLSSSSICRHRLF